MPWLKRYSNPGPYSPRYLLNLKSRLYIGQFDNLIHAFNHWRQLVEREQWFIVSTKNAVRITSHWSGMQSGRWHKLEDPRPLRVSPKSRL